MTTKWFLNKDLLRLRQILWYSIWLSIMMASHLNIFINCVLGKAHYLGLVLKMWNIHIVVQSNSKLMYLSYQMSILLYFIYILCAHVATRCFFLFSSVCCLPFSLYVVQFWAIKNPIIHLHHSNLFMRLQIIADRSFKNLKTRLRLSKQPINKLELNL